jgi:hypothetical protein
VDHKGNPALRHGAFWPTRPVKCLAYADLTAHTHLIVARLSAFIGDRETNRAPASLKHGSGAMPLRHSWHLEKRTNETWKIIGVFAIVFAVFVAVTLVLTWWRWIDPSPDDECLGMTKCGRRLVVTSWRGLKHFAIEQPKNQLQRQGQKARAGEHEITKLTRDLVPGTCINGTFLLHDRLFFRITRRPSL